MRFSLQPSTVAAGDTFSVSVELLDPRNVRVPTPDTVSIVAEDGTPLSGTTTVVTSGGVATFDDLAITAAGTGLQLKASTGTLAAVSNVFTVTAGRPTLQTSFVSPVSPPVAIDAPRTLTFTFLDAFGNRLRSQPVSVTSDLAGVTLAPGSGTTSATGAFSTVITATTAGTVILTATIGGTQIAFAPLLVQPQCTPEPMTIPGVVSGIQPTETCVVGGLPTLLYRFTTASPGGVLFSLTSGFPSALSVTADPPGDAVVLRGGTSHNAEWLLPAGTYQVSVGAVTGSGSFTLTSASVAGNQGQVIRNIAVSGTYPQALGAGDFMFPEVFGDNSFWDVFRMRSTGSCTITARATGTTGLDLLLVLADSAGDPFAGDDNSGGGSDAQISLNPCSASNGPLLVMVNHYLETGSGPYSLTVAFTPGEPSRAVLSPAMTMSSVEPWDVFRARLRATKRGGFSPRPH
jgi:hypothetical protein